MENTHQLEGYKPLYQRLPEFLAKYPAERYGYEVTHANFWQYDVTLLEQLAGVDATLAREMIADLLRRPKVIVTITMRDHLQKGRIVIQRSAVGPVDGYKDFEAIETAAFQRILAALGFDGQTMRDDERRDWSRQGFEVASDKGETEVTQEPPKSAKSAAPEAKEQTRTRRRGGKSRAAAQQTSLLEQATSTQGEPDKSEPSTLKTSNEEAADSGSDVPSPQPPKKESQDSTVALKRLAETLAQHLGEEVEIPESQEELKRLVRNLMQRKKHAGRLETSES